MGSLQPLLKKYQTGNKIYIYVQGENNRSFNYYDTFRKVYGFNNNGEENKTDDWPILIKEIDSDKELFIEYKIDNRINKLERQVSLEVLSSKQSYMNKKDGATNLLLNKGEFMSHDFGIPPTSTIVIENNEPLPLGLSLQTSGINYGKIIGTPSKTDVKKLTFVITSSNGIIRKEKLTFYVGAINILLKFNIDATSNKACSDFIFINVMMKQDFPLQNYFNQLWIPNIKSSVEVDSSDNKMYWATYDRNRNISLYDTIGETAIIQNKVIFDTGKKKTGTTIIPKKRRLFTAITKHNSGSGQDFDNLTIDNVSSGYISESKTATNYFINLFTDSGFSIYKGIFIDSQTSQVVNSLCLFNESSLFQKYSYMLLGITDDEYNKFTIPTGADNLFFNLEEVAAFASENVRKFKLGIRYEDGSTGTINNAILYPSTDINVYSIDDLYFFSKEYSDYQEFYNEFAPIKVEFRTIPRYIDPNPLGLIPYFGEFGFDWLRIGDNYYKNYSLRDLLPDIDFSLGIEGGYKRPQTLTDSSEFSNKNEAYKFLKRQYYSLPLKDNKIYSIPYLTIFSENFKNGFILKTDSDGDIAPAPPFEAILRILITNPSPASTGSIKFVCDSVGLVKFDKEIIKTLTDNSHKQINLTLKITCLRDTAEQKNIKVLYFPAGTSTKDISKGQLAGVIILNKNDMKARKKVNVVFINCTTNIDSDINNEKFPFSADNKKTLCMKFFQSLLLPEIEVYGLSLENNSKFKINDTDDFVYIESATSDKVLNTDKYLQIFQHLTSKIPDNYTTKYLRMYSFDLYGRSFSNITPNLAGITEGIGKRQVIIYRTPFNNRNDTIPHEGLHALGLYHTHRDEGAAVTEPDRKFIFIHASDPNNDANQFKSTDNNMSYSLRRNNVWNWQRKILYRYLKNESI